MHTPVPAAAVKTPQRGVKKIIVLVSIQSFED